MILYGPTNGGGVSLFLCGVEAGTIKAQPIARARGKEPSASVSVNDVVRLSTTLMPLMPGFFLPFDVVIVSVYSDMPTMPA